MSVKMVNAKSKEWKIASPRRQCFHCGKFIRSNSKSDFCCSNHEMFNAMSEKDTLTVTWTFECTNEKYIKML